MGVSKRDTDRTKRTSTTCLDAEEVEVADMEEDGAAAGVVMRNITTLGGMRAGAMFESIRDTMDLATALVLATTIIATHSTTMDTTIRQDTTRSS